MKTAMPTALAGGRRVRASAIYSRVKRGSWRPQQLKMDIFNCKMLYSVAEIFASIEGEGKRAGQLATFIRLAGCNLRCSYCDTTYAQEKTDGELLDIAEIMEAVEKHGLPNITITGGEPLYAGHIGDLLQNLVAKGKIINIETNGSFSLAPYRDLPNTFFTMDWKTPSSGVCQNMLMENFGLLRENDVLKIVMAKEDFEAVFDLLAKIKTRAAIYLSPIFGKIEPRDLVDFAKQAATLDNVDATKLQIQLQLHKYIWPQDARGV